MSCSETYISADEVFEYVFEDSPLTHLNTRLSCNNRGWILATNLTLDDFQILDNCCNTTKTYRIGLAKQFSKCDQSSDLRYSWLTSRSCTNGSPLNITGVIPELCQAVAIPVGGLGDTGYNVRLSNCSDRLPYICQKRSPTTTPQSTIVATTSTTGLSAGAIVTTPQTPIVEVTAPTDLSDGVIAGIIAGSLLAIFSFLLLFCYLKKCVKESPKLNKCGWQKTNCFFTNSNKNNGRNRWDSSNLYVLH